MRVHVSMASPLSSDATDIPAVCHTYSAAYSTARVIKYACVCACACACVLACACTRAFVCMCAHLFACAETAYSNSIGPIHVQSVYRLEFNCALDLMGPRST